MADSPSLDLRDWKRPASSPYFSVVSSREVVVSVSVLVLASSSVLKMWRAVVLDTRDEAARRWREILELECWKETAPSRMARATMSDFVKRKIRERIMVYYAQLFVLVGRILVQGWQMQMD